MNPSTDRLMGVAEAVACAGLAVICVSAAMDGESIAWLYGVGSLTFAWDLWRRFGRAKGPA
jgi:hypothetical protein